MILRYFIYGEVAFNAANKRTAAGRRLDSRASRAGFVPEVWSGLVDVYGPWPAGRADVTTAAGLPGLRFCYATSDPAIALEATEDVAAAWDVFKDSDSWWGFVAVPV